VFEKDTGVKLKVVSAGTGQAIKTGKDGNADVLFVHDKKSEEEFVSGGDGIERIEIMYNYFVVVGPKDDPAGIKAAGENNAAAALKKIMDSKANFISRGDESGTHKKELSLWKSLSITPSGSWYISAGKGMGAVLSMAGEKKAYTLTDKATYLSMKDKLDLQIVLESGNDLMNQYTVMGVNPEKHKSINKKGAQKFIEWITSDKALKMINEYGKDKYGENLFTVNYKK
jgi:tungstate transport system substrate-binding protein